MQLLTCIRTLTEPLQNHNVDKVILVVHSQGGIISSNAVELLVREIRIFANVDANSLFQIQRHIPVRKLEIYTFGSAADEFMQIYDEKTNQWYS